MTIVTVVNTLLKWLKNLAYPLSVRNKKNNNKNNFEWWEEGSLLSEQQKVHNWHESLRVGTEGEKYLDTLLSEEYDIIPATDIQQRHQGIDRILVDKKTNCMYAVEYKADNRTSKTGNIFIEVVSNDIRNSLGWAKKSQAQLLYYYDIGNGLIYILNMYDIKVNLDLWASKYETKKVWNKGYKSYGIIVPVKDIEKIALKVIRVE